MAESIRFFSGSSNPQLAEGIAAELDIRLDPVHISRYSNDILHIRLDASIRHRRVFFVQSISEPTDSHLMELLMMLNVARRASASEVVAIIPYFAFGRSDKKMAPNSSVSARLVADLLKTAGATHVMSMTLHSPQVEEFFDISVDSLSSRSLFNTYLSRTNLSDTIVVAPDVVHAASAERLAGSINLPVAVANKERISDTEVSITGFVGNQVLGHKHVLIYEDEISTGDTVLELSRLLVKEGIEDIKVICTHGVFRGDGLQRLVDFPRIKEIITTDTIRIPPEKRNAKLKVLSVASTFASAVRRYLQQEPSINDLFVFGEGLAGDSTTDAPPPPKKK